MAWRSSTFRVRVPGDGRLRASAFGSFAYASQFSPHDTALTNRCSQPLAVAMTGFNFMKQSLVFATLAPASGG